MYYMLGKKCRFVIIPEVINKLHLPKSNQDASQCRLDHVSCSGLICGGHHFQAELGIGSSVVGINAAQETCGQVRPAKLRKTV